MKNQSIMRLLLFAAALVTLSICTPPEIASQEANQTAVRNIRAELKGDYIVAQQGTDENAQSVSVRIWGSLRDAQYFENGFRRLSDITNEQYVIVSRNEGTGPYYRLQIIDFKPNGILVWSYPSEGKPQFKDKKTLLGKFKTGKNEGVGTSLIYSAYRFTENGLVLSSE